ncbi:hypothetical protein GCM10009554_05300 [Kribbella koreensis]|uniref:Urease subunit beta n=1 Tax=Kribbella koreensis TaxID=57909 RepID=A0ABN1PCK5_9ACTN
MSNQIRLSNEGQGAGNWGPGAVRVAPGTIELNAGRQKLTLVIVNTGDRPVQIGSHLHLPDANTALAFDREAAQGFRLDIPSGTSQRFEPGASREVGAVALAGRRLVPGIQLKPTPADLKPTPGGATPPAVDHG